jgi:hypothetical protein
MSSRKNNPIRVLRVKKDDDLRTIYAKARKAFTAADLQRVTDIAGQKWVPADQLLAELEAIHREEVKKMRRQKKKKKKARS